MKKIIKLLIVFVMLLGASVSLVACGDETIDIEFAEKIKYYQAVYQEKSDLTKYVKKVKGWEYYIEAYQINSELKEVILETEGLTFTPTVLDDVHITLCAKKGDNVQKSIEYILSVIKPKNPIDEKIKVSWHDPSFAVDINTEAQYIHGDNSTSVKVSWFGSEPSYKDRFQYWTTLMGDDITQYYSVTNWEDAVLSFWVYNPTEYDLEFVPIWSHNGANLELMEDPRLLKVAKAGKDEYGNWGQWTEIKYSLRYYGITENFFYDEGLYKSYVTENVQYGIGEADDGKPNINQNWWTVRWNGREDLNIPYGYNFYVSNFDIRDYDETIDSELDHRLGVFRSTTKEFQKDYSFELTDSATESLSFEYKINSGNTISLQLFEIEAGEWTKYFGTFNFNAQGAVENYNGINTKIIDDNYVRVEIIFSQLNKYGWDGVPKKINLFYFNDGDAQGEIDKIETDKVDVSNILRGQQFKKNDSISTASPALSSITFEYKITSGEKISLQLYQLNGAVKVKSFGAFELNATGEVSDYAGVTTKPLKYGYVKAEIIFSQLDKSGVEGKPSEINQIYFNDGDAQGVIDRIEINTLDKENLPRGQAFSSQVDFNTNISAVTSLTFEYKLITEGKMAIAVMDANWEKYYGYYEFDSNGELDNSAGVTCQKLADGYVRVTLNFAELNKTCNSWDRANVPEVVEIFYIRKMVVEGGNKNWTTADGYIYIVND